MKVAGLAVLPRTMSGDSSFKELAVANTVFTVTNTATNALQMDVCFGLKNSANADCSLDHAVKKWTTTFFNQMLMATMAVNSDVTKTTLREIYEWKGVCSTGTSSNCRAMKGSAIGTAATAADLANSTMWLTDDDNSVIHAIT